MLRLGRESWLRVCPVTQHLPQREINPSVITYKTSGVIVSQLHFPFPVISTSFLREIPFLILTRIVILLNVAKTLKKTKPNTKKKVFRFLSACIPWFRIFNHLSVKNRWSGNIAFSLRHQMSRLRTYEPDLFALTSVTHPLFVCVHETGCWY